jgi:hypothetical protein
MKRSMLFFILALGCLVLRPLNTPAQEPSPTKRRPPRLTSDDVTRSRNQGSVTVIKTFDATKWTKYTPGNLGFSLELPGGLELSEVTVPDKLKAPASPEVRDMRVFSYLVDPLHAFIGYVKLKSPATSATMKDITVQLMNALAQRPGQSNARFGADPTSKSRTVFWASYTKDGYLLNVIGSVQSKGDTLLMLMSVSHQGDEVARTMAQRILKSATME